MSTKRTPQDSATQYTVAGLKSYEAIYGRDFVSPGGRRTTADMLAALEFVPGMHVLDVGSGLGGASFMMAREFGLRVDGIDLSTNMVEESLRRCEVYGLSDQVKLKEEDIMKLSPSGSYDLIWSRDTFLHVHAKSELFTILYRSLRPGGRLFFTDYCCGEDPITPDFQSYIDEFGYDLRPVSAISRLISDSGFVSVSGLDISRDFINIHRRELDGLDDTGLSTTEKDELRVGWEAKISRAESGQQVWGRFEAMRPDESGPPVSAAI